MFFFQSNLLKLNFMRKFGYLDSSSTTTSETLYHEDAITAGIRNMQKYGGLNETGILDSATLKVSSKQMILSFLRLFKPFLSYKICIV